MVKKRLFALFAAISCLLMLVLCLAACGPDYRSNFVGDWRVISMQDSDGVDKTPTIEQMAAVNKYITLSLVEEGDEAIFDMADKKTLTGTWEPKGETTCMIDIVDYEPIVATLSEDGTLVFEDEGMVMTCEKLSVGSDEAEEPAESNE